MLKPVQQRAIAWAHEKGIVARLHSCGNINKLVPELVDIGLDGLNPLEVKATAGPSRADARHLAWLRDSIGDRFVAGAVLHTGPDVFSLGDRILAVPICAFWA